MICRSLGNVSKYDPVVYLSRKTNAFFSLDYITIKNHSL